MEVFLLHYSWFSMLKQFVKFETYTLKILEMLFSKLFRSQSLILYYQFAHAQAAYFFSHLIFNSFLGKKLADGKGLSSKGHFTLTRIDTIQNFSGKSIRKNKGNTPKYVKGDLGYFRPIL